MEERLQVGVITTTHGLKGEVKVFPTTDDVTRYEVLKNVYLDTGKEQIAVEIESVKYFKQFVIVKFKEFGDINQVEKYKKCPILVDRKDAAPLEEDEYYITDMEGIRVVTDEREELGTLKEVLSTGANDVYVIDSPQHGEVLIPAIKECILDVDIPGRKMTVHLLKGLI